MAHTSEQPPVRMDQIMEEMLPDERCWDPGKPWQAGWMYNATSFHDVRRILTDQSAFSLDVPGNDPDDPEGSLVLGGYWTQPWPQHKELEEVVGPQFRPPQKIERRFGPVTQQVLDTHVDNLLEAGDDTFDFASTVGRIPAEIISAYAGVDANDALVKQWVTDANLVQESPEQKRRMSELLGGVLENCEDTLPSGAVLEDAQDVVQALVIAMRNKHPVLGKPLSRNWAVGQLAMVIAAGDDTTGTTLGTALQAFTLYGKMDDIRQRNVQQMDVATQEVIRRYPAFPRGFGVALHEVELGTDDARIVVPKGATVAAWMSAANHDASRFDDPYDFAVDRRPNPHLGLGAGARYCTGVYLAKHILNHTLSGLAQRLPGLEWDGQPVTRRHGEYISVQSIPEGGMTLGFNVREARRSAARSPR